MIEWDEIDATVQPFTYTPYQVSGAAAANTWNMGIDPGQPISGIEYMCRFTLTAPDGAVHNGLAHVEHLVFGRYEPYGFE